MESPIKQAFSKVKQDILSLQSEIFSIKHQLEELTRTLNTSTLRQITPTDRQQISNTPTHDLPLEAPETPNFNISTGNRGVPTDRQTDQQTDNKHQKFAQLSENKEIEYQEKLEEIEKPLEVSNVLNSISSLRIDLQKKFKSLTNQEFLVFTTLYMQEEQGKNPDYHSLSIALKLTESSIRDYILRIIKKGIPVDKTKINNKKIILSLSENLKKLASLETIINIREASKR